MKMKKIMFVLLSLVMFLMTIVGSLADFERSGAENHFDTHTGYAGAKFDVEQVLTIYNFTAYATSVPSVTCGLKKNVSPYVDLSSGTIDGSYNCILDHAVVVNGSATDGFAYISYYELNADHTHNYLSVPFTVDSGYINWFDAVFYNDFGASYGHIRTLEYIGFSVGDDLGGEPPPVVPVVTNIYPVNNDHNRDKNFSFNVDIDCDNCSLFIDGVLNVTQNNINNFTVPTLSGTNNLSWYVTCRNNSQEGNSSAFIYVYDDVNPLWFTSVKSDNSSVINSSVLYYNYTYNETATDTYLFNVNFSIYWSNGSLKLYGGQYNTSNISFHFGGVTSLNKYDNYTFKYYASDDHTAKWIPDNWFVDKNSDSLFFDTGSVNVSIRFDDRETSLKALDSVYAVDRYNFIFSNDFSKKLDEYEYEFYLESSKKIYDRTILWDGIPTFVTGNSWIDFRLKNDIGVVYDVFKISDKIYKIRLKSENEFLEFDSIGGLNIVEYTYNLEFRNNTPPLPTAPVVNSTPISVSYSNAPERTVDYVDPVDNYPFWVQKTLFFKVPLPSIGKEIKPNNFLQHLFDFSGVLITGVYLWVLVFLFWFFTRKTY